MTAAPSATQLHKALDQEQIDLFRRRGFIIIGKLLDDDLVALLRDEYDRLFAEARQNGRFRNLSISDTDDLDEKNNADEQMLQIMQMCERSILFRSTALRHPHPRHCRRPHRPQYPTLPRPSPVQTRSPRRPRLLAPRQRLLEMYASQLG